MLGRFLAVMEREQANFGGAPTWVPQPGREAEASQLRFEVDRVAGRAAYGLAVAGSYIDWKPRGTMQFQRVGPAQAWATILDRDPMFDAETILACCSQAIGVLEMKAEYAEEQESRPVRRFVGRTARLTGSGLKPVAKWTARAVGTIVLALVIAGMTYWLGWS